MRFEEMDFLEQINTLSKFHKRINRDFFNNELKTIKLDVENINKGDPENDGYACFRSKAIFFNPETLTPYFDEKISFDNVFIEFLREQKTQKLQSYYIGFIMLHEMVHQYCYENGIDDTNHANGWSQAALDHHLVSKYTNGKIDYDYPDEMAVWVFSTYRL